ncbi:MAG: HAMP domain-containing sensor histidine kinase [Deferrisomatales bacterium]|nr:HAMP domain-containing sensor histidine kinase [Deferrisomatales bacterium]
MPRALRSSILLKLLLVLVLTGVVVNLLVGGFFRLVPHGSPRSARRVLLADHVQRMVQDIGVPPDRARARELASRLSLGIRYEGPTTRWSVGESIPPHAALTLAPTIDPNVRTAWRDRTLFLSVDRPPGRFLFSVDLHRERDYPEGWVVLLVLLLTAAFAAAYFAVRWILKPLQWLTAGVQAVSAGDLEHRVRRRGDDDLGELAASFNVMTGRIRDMIHTRWELLLNVSHELRSPLTRSKLALEFLPDIPARESIREDLADMETMLGEILETERLQSPHGGLHRRQVDLATLLREVAEPFRGRPPGVELRLPAGPLPLSVDPDRLCTAVRNVLENAVKHAERDAPVELTLEAAGEELVIRVRNRGAPIPAAELPLLLEPFYRADKSRSKETGGYGLGLSLCRTILELHGGSVTITSDVREGTVVSLRLPRGGTANPSGPQEPWRRGP